MSLWTDGSIKTQHPLQPGGFAFVSVHNGKVIHTGKGGCLGGTSQRMEMMAAIAALGYIRPLASKHDGDIYLFSDSQYMVKGITEWVYQWPKCDWRTSTGKPVKNQDLWHQLQVAREGLRVRWHWVPGHKGIEFNEMADVAAKSAVEGVLNAWHTSRRVTSDRAQNGGSTCVA